MMAQYEARRAARQRFGPTYRCRECTLMLPAEAFDVERNDPTDLLSMLLAQDDAKLTEKCIALGAWRVCSVCVRVPSSTSTTRCTRCEQERWQGYFSTASTVCDACHQREK